MQASAIHRFPVFVLRLFIPFIVLALAAIAAPCRAADPAIPNFWDARERLAKPDISELQRVRFLTTVDFPPFNFLDTSGRLSGFHVDLARAICRKLSDRRRERVGIAGWHKDPGAGSDDLRDPTDVRRDDRPARRECPDQRRRQRVRSARVNNKIGCR